MSTLVLLERTGPAAVITLNRPEKRNALSRTLVAALADTLRQLEADSAIRAIILAANGPAFCAGLDLVELSDTLRLPDARSQMLRDSRELAAAYRLLSTSSKPTIAAVQGPAVAGGAGLVTACDLAIATPEARFGYPEVRRGIVPAIITPMLLRIVPTRMASYLLLTGQLIDATEALRAGVYGELVVADRLRATALARASEIAHGAPETIGHTKRWMERCWASSQLWAEAADASAAGRFTSECDEGLSAFREQREPNWAPPPGGTS
jgi:methylglutaconyl-CoA hydratase